LSCGEGFRKCIGEYQPDLVVSLHPLCQNLPLQVLKTLHKEGELPRVPFATVCTDLGGAHLSWFKKETDLVFIPSNAVRKVALRRGIKPSKIRQYGLPVRSDFWRASDPSARPSEAQYTELGLQPDKRTVLVVGGGDGVGSLGSIVDATASTLAEDLPPDTAQVVALCGKNKKVLKQLEAMKADGAWSGVNVELRGFTSQISSYMEVADCLVTKAGPGTIAEAAIRALPTMLSSFLPGQEAGNVPFVLEHGFGEYSTEPKVIGARVASWLQDDAARARMRSCASAAATPLATHDIAVDLLQLLDDWSDEPASARPRRRRRRVSRAAVIEEEADGGD